MTGEIVEGVRQIPHEQVRATQRSKTVDVPPLRLRLRPVTVTTSLSHMFLNDTGHERIPVKIGIFETKIRFGTFSAFLASRLCGMVEWQITHRTEQKLVRENSKHAFRSQRQQHEAPALELNDMNLIEGRDTNPIDGKHNDLINGVHEKTIYGAERSQSRPI